MRQAAGQLRGQLALVGLGQHRARLRFLGHVGGQQVDAVDGAFFTDPVRREGGPDPAAGILVGEFEHARFPFQRPLQVGPQPLGRANPERLFEGQTDDLVAAPGQDRGQAAVGEGIDSIGIHVTDMGRGHFRGQAGARLHLGQAALGFLQLRNGGFQLAVGARQLLGAG